MSMNPPDGDADYDDGAEMGIHHTRAHTINLPNGRERSQFDPEFSIIRKLDGRISQDSDGDWEADRSNPHVV